MLYPAELRAPALCYIEAMQRPASVLLTLLSLLLAPAGGRAAVADDGEGFLPRIEVAGALPGLRLADGTEAQLAGIQIPGCTDGEASLARWCAAALSHVQAFLDKSNIATEAAGIDRWRRPLLVVRTLDGSELQSELLHAGLALVDPLTAPTQRIDAWLEAERRAREARRGIWGADGPAAEMAEVARAGSIRFGRVCGRVHRAAGARYGVFLNFGEDRRRDFTVRLAPATVRALQAQEREPRAFAGHQLCVRGWMFAAGAVMIDIIDPLQIEPVP